MVYKLLYHIERENAAGNGAFPDCATGNLL